MKNCSSLDYDPVLMTSKEAIYILDYLEEYAKPLVEFLKMNDVYYNFAYPYVTYLFELKQAKIISGFQSHEALSESLKEVTALLASRTNNLMKCLKMK